MEKEFRQSLSIKERVIVWALNLVEMIIKALLDNSTFETNGKQFKYAYNGVACR